MTGPLSVIILEIQLSDSCSSELMRLLLNNELRACHYPYTWGEFSPLELVGLVGLVGLSRP